MKWKKREHPPVKQKKAELVYPWGWNSSLGETRVDYHSRKHMENLHTAPNEWDNYHDPSFRASQQTRTWTALELRLMGLAPEPKGSPRGPGSTTPPGTSSSAASSSASPSSSSSGLAHYLRAGTSFVSTPVVCLPPAPRRPAPRGGGGVARFLGGA
jgi:hypothetical protein